MRSERGKVAEKYEARLPRRDRCDYRIGTSHAQPKQKPEQQVAFAVHVAPTTPQLVVDAPHTPLVQVPLQHCAELVHAAASAMHALLHVWLAGSHAP